MKILPLGKIVILISVVSVIIAAIIAGSVNVGDKNNSTTDIVYEYQVTVNYIDGTTQIYDCNETREPGFSKSVLVLMECKQADNQNMRIPYDSMKNYFIKEM